MKKLLLLFLAMATCSIAAQEADFVKVYVDVDKKLYPVEGDDSYSSSDSHAMIGATYMDGDFARAEPVLETISGNMMLQDIQRSNFIAGNKKVSSIAGNVLHEVAGQAMYMELYLIEAKGPTGTDGVILIMSGYPVAEKPVYGAEGKKAVLSASVAQ